MIELIIGLFVGIVLGATALFVFLALGTNVFKKDR